MLCSLRNIVRGLTSRKIGWAEIQHIRVDKKYPYIIVWKPEGYGHLGKYRRGREEDIALDLTETGGDGVG
jgi:hypothetical protein